MIVNLLVLTEFLTAQRNTTSKLDIELRLGYSWGDDLKALHQGYYWPTLSVAIGLRRKLLEEGGGEVRVHVKIHPKFLDEWVDILVSLSYV